MDITASFRNSRVSVCYENTTGFRVYPDGSLRIYGRHRSALLFRSTRAFHPANDEPYLAFFGRLDKSDLVRE